MEVLPFENPNLIEKITEKTDTALFCFGSNTKKKPHNLIIGRIFNNAILDMAEFGIFNCD